MAAIDTAAPRAALAQISPGPTRDLGGPQEQFEVRPRPGIQLDTPAAPQADPRTGATFVLTEVRFTGITAFDPAELGPAVGPWLGKRTSPSDLTSLVNAVTQALRERGLYAAVARLPDQTITDGVATIEIVEGRIGEVEVRQNERARLKPEVAARFLSRLRPGALIARGTLDTPLLLLNDLPGIVVQPSLSAGSAAGTADLLVRVDDQPLLGGFLRLDNHQISELGEYELTGHFRLRNPSGIGDLATADLVRSSTSGRTRGAVTYSAPIGHRGTRIGALYSQQRYRLGGAFEPLRANGDHDRVAVVASHPFVRQDSRNLGASLSFTHIDYHDRLDAVGLSSDIRHRFGTARLFGDLSDTLLGGGLTAAYVELQSGDVELKTPAVAAADAAGLGVAGAFSRVRLHFDRTQVLTRSSTLFAAWTAQFASGNLDVGRDIELSGPHGVRAYPLGELIVDEGHLAQVEYRHALPIFDTWRTTAAVFFDAARGRINRDPIPGTPGNTRELWGYGLGLTASHGVGFNVQLVVAWRGSEAPLTDPGRNPRFWFALTQYF